jgi:hypothetical protein
VIHKLPGFETKTEINIDIIVAPEKNSDAIIPNNRITKADSTALNCFVTSVTQIDCNAWGFLGRRAVKEE